MESKVQALDTQPSETDACRLGRMCSVSDAIRKVSINDFLIGERGDILDSGGLLNCIGIALFDFHNSMAAVVGHFSDPFYHKDKRSEMFRAARDVMSLNEAHCILSGFGTDRSHPGAIEDERRLLAVVEDAGITRNRIHIDWNLTFNDVSIVTVDLLSERAVVHRYDDFRDPPGFHYSPTCPDGEFNLVVRCDEKGRTTSTRAHGASPRSGASLPGVAAP